MTLQMRGLFAYAIVLAAPFTSDFDDDTCHPDWNGLRKDGSSVSSTTRSTASGVNIGNRTSQSGIAAANPDPATMASAGSLSRSMPIRPMNQPASL